MVSKIKESMERTYNIPLRKGTHKAPAYKRAAKAVKVLKTFVMKHMKVTEVKIGKELNEKLWLHGIRNPPHHINVNVKKEKDVATVELVGVEYKGLKVAEKKEKGKGLKGKLDELKGKVSGEGLEEAVKESKVEGKLKETEEKVKREVKEKAKKVVDVKAEVEEVKPKVA